MSGKVGVPGLGAAKGVLGFPVLKTGDYLVETHAPDIKEAKNGKGNNFAFKFDVVDGPDQDNGVPASSRKYFERAWVPNENYDGTATSFPGVELIAALAKAAGIKITDDGIDEQKFEGCQIAVSLSVYMDKDQRDPDAKAVPRNKIVAAYAAEDYQGSDGSPAPKAKAAAAKKPAANKAKKS